MTTLVYTSNIADLATHSHKYDLKSTVVVSGDLSTATKSFKENHFDKLHFYLTTCSLVDESVLFSAYQSLKAGGKVHIESQEDFKDTKIYDLITISGLTGPIVQGNTVEASKPSWTGNSTSVSLKSKQKPQTNGDQKMDIESTNGKTHQPAPKKENPFAKFKIDNADLVDENALLNDDPSYNQLAKAEDCSVKPKACKNCSCGRKELEYTYI